MKRALWKLIRGYIYCILAILCLCMAGSDGDYFPWVNIVGTLVLVIMAMVHLRRHAKRDIMTWAEQRSALNSVRDLNRRFERLTENRRAANNILKSRGAATSRN